MDDGHSPNHKYLLDTFQNVAKVLSKYEKDQAQWISQLDEELKNSGPINRWIQTLNKNHNTESGLINLLSGLVEKDDKKKSREHDAMLGTGSNDGNRNFDLERSYYMDQFQLELTMVTKLVEVIRTNEVHRAERLLNSFESLKAHRIKTLQDEMKNLKSSTGYSKVENRKRELEFQFQKLEASLIEKRNLVNLNAARQKISSEELRNEFEREVNDLIRKLIQEVEKLEEAASNLSKEKQDLEEATNQAKDELSRLLHDLDHPPTSAPPPPTHPVDPPHSDGSPRLNGIDGKKAKPGKTSKTAIKKKNNASASTVSIASGASDGSNSKSTNLHTVSTSTLDSVGGGGKESLESVIKAVMESGGYSGTPLSVLDISEQTVQDSQFALQKISADLQGIEAAVVDSEHQLNVTRSGVTDYLQDDENKALERLKRFSIQLEGKIATDTKRLALLERVLSHMDEAGHTGHGTPHHPPHRRESMAPTQQHHQATTTPHHHHPEDHLSRSEISTQPSKDSLFDHPMMQDEDIPSEKGVAVSSGGGMRDGSSSGLLSEGSGSHLGRGAVVMTDELNEDIEDDTPLDRAMNPLALHPSPSSSYRMSEAVSPSRRGLLKEVHIPSQRIASQLQLTREEEQSRFVLPLIPHVLHSSTTSTRVSPASSPTQDLQILTSSELQSTPLLPLSASGVRGAAPSTLLRSSLKLGVIGNNLASTSPRLNLKPQQQQGKILKIGSLSASPRGHGTLTDGEDSIKISTSTDIDPALLKGLVPVPTASSTRNTFPVVTIEHSSDTGTTGMVTGSAFPAHTPHSPMIERYSKTLAAKFNNRVVNELKTIKLRSTASAVSPLHPSSDPAASGLHHPLDEGAQRILDMLKYHYLMSQKPIGLEGDNSGNDHQKLFHYRSEDLDASSIRQEVSRGPSSAVMKPAFPRVYRSAFISKWSSVSPETQASVPLAGIVLEDEPSSALNPLGGAESSRSIQKGDSLPTSFSITGVKIPPPIAAIVPPATTTATATATTTTTTATIKQQTSSKASSSTTGTSAVQSSETVLKVEGRTKAHVSNLKVRIQDLSFDGLPPPSSPSHTATTAASFHPPPLTNHHPSPCMTDLIHDDPAVDPSSTPAPGPVSDPPPPYQATSDKSSTSPHGTTPSYTASPARKARKPKVRPQTGTLLTFSEGTETLSNASSDAPDLSIVGPYSVNQNQSAEEEGFFSQSFGLREAHDQLASLVTILSHWGGKGRHTSTGNSSELLRLRSAEEEFDGVETLRREIGHQLGLIKAVYERQREGNQTRWRLQSESMRLFQESERCRDELLKAIEDSSWSLQYKAGEYQLEMRDVGQQMEGLERELQSWEAKIDRKNKLNVQIAKRLVRGMSSLESDDKEDGYEVEGGVHENEDPVTAVGDYDSQARKEDSMTGLLDIDVSVDKIPLDIRASNGSLFQIPDAKIHPNADPSARSVDPTGSGPVSSNVSSVHPSGNSDHTISSIANRLSKIVYFSDFLADPPSNPYDPSDPFDPSHARAVSGSYNPAGPTGEDPRHPSIHEEGSTFPSTPLVPIPLRPASMPSHPLGAEINLHLPTVRPLRSQSMDSETSLQTLSMDEVGSTHPRDGGHHQEEEGALRPAEEFYESIRLEDFRPHNEADEYLIRFIPDTLFH